MKSLTHVTLACLIATPLLVGQDAKSDKKPVFREAANHQSLALKSRRAPNPLKNMTALEGKDPTKENQPVNLIEQSDIICFNGMATLVPKRAIISTPERYKSRCKYVEGAKIVSWTDFYSRNRGWITSLEVTRKQAEGNDLIDEKVSEHIQKSGKLIVATYQGGPISMLPPKEADDVEDAGNQEQPAKQNSKPTIR